MSASEAAWHRTSNLDHLPSDPQAALLGSEQLSPSPLSTDTHVDNQVKQEKSAVDRRPRSILWHGLHLIIVLFTLFIICLNVGGFYWKDLGLPHQNAKLQAFQYGAKVHEMMMTTSLTAIVLYQFRSDLYGSKGVPLGFLTAGFQLNAPSFLATQKFRKGATARAHSSGWSRFSRLTYLLVLGFALTSVVGPSSAIAMIPRLGWWDMSQVQAFGGEYNDRLYFNRTEAELWPGDITNEIYPDVSCCDGATNISKQDCAVGARDVVAPWIFWHQSEGTKPNITVLQDSEVTRYLTSEGGPPDNSSWTVSSTIGYILAKDLNHYWDWQVENGSLPTSVSRPLLRPAFINSTFKFKKPLVQAQCQSYLNPDWEKETFEFPHDELLTPPLDAFRNDTWNLPNEFVLNLKGNDSSIYDPEHLRISFDWFDAASNFSSQGAPSLGAVVIYFATNGTAVVPVLTTCSFDGRWTPVEYYLEPKDTITIRQDSPSPMDILNGSRREAPNEFTRMRMSLDWANTLNIQSFVSDVPSTTVVEEMLSWFSGDENFIYPEPEKTATAYVMKSLDWRLSTALGLYLTEGLARAFSDSGKGSMLYRQATKSEKQSYVRRLSDINQPACMEGYKNGKLDWVETSDSRWNHSIPPWDEWAPLNGYTEIKMTVQRNGYGYGFEGVPIMLAAIVLEIYIALVCVHLYTMYVDRRIYQGLSDMGDMLALAWGSAPTVEMKNLSAGIKNHQTWRRVVKVREKEGRLQLV